MVVTQEAVTKMARTVASAPETEENADLPGLKVRGLSVAYGDLRVLSGVDFEVATGGLVALVGENGAGKSTLVRCIAGDDIPDGRGSSPRRGAGSLQCRGCLRRTGRGVAGRRFVRQPGRGEQSFPGP